MPRRPRSARTWTRVIDLFRLFDFRRDTERGPKRTHLGLEPLEPREMLAAVLVGDVQHFSDPASAFIPYGNTSTTLTLTHPVAMNRTLVTGSTSHPADWAGNSVVRFELVDTNGSPATAEAVRVTRGRNGGNATSGRLDFSVDVTEFLSGVTVEQQQVTIGSSATSATTTLGTSWVSDRSFVVLSQSTADDTPNSDGRWSVRGALTGGGNTLTVSRAETGAAVVVAAQVLTLDADSGSNVQAGQLTLSSTTASASYTTTSGAGDLLFFSSDAPAATGVEAKYRVRGTASGGTVNFTTLAAGGATVDYYVVSIARATVQTGTVSFAAATTNTGGSSSLYTQSASIASVDPTRSFVQVTASGGDSSRRDTLGDTAFKATLTGSDAVVLTRADRSDTPVVPTYGTAPQWNRSQLRRGP